MLPTLLRRALLPRASPSLGLSLLTPASSVPGLNLFALSRSCSAQLQSPLQSLSFTTSARLSLPLPSLASSPLVSSFRLASPLLSSSSLLHARAAPLMPYTRRFVLSQQSRGFASERHKRVIRACKGFRGRGNRIWKVSVQRLEKSLQYAYRDRRTGKRLRRTLWIQRLNAASREHGLPYSQFVHLLAREVDASVGGLPLGVTVRGIESKGGVRVCRLNRKVLADLAANEPFSFKAVVDTLKLKAGWKQPKYKNGEALIKSKR